MQAAIPSLERLATPCLLHDEARITRNIRRLADRAATRDVSLRPHRLTAKSTKAAPRALTGGFDPKTMSRNRGTSAQTAGQGEAITALRPGLSAPLPNRPLGIRQQSRPFHVRASAAQHDSCHLILADRSAQLQQWHRFGGW